MGLFKSLFLTLLFAVLACTAPLPQSNTPDIITIGDPPTPSADYTLVQVGFTYPLNYNFVASQPTAVQQIAQYLPKAIADDLGIAESEVVIVYLAPLDEGSYLATVARLYIPNSEVGQLAKDIITPTSPLYHNSDATVTALTALIDPGIPISP
ncbi:hypothetical protein F5Y19DRAFT_483581 [Xylariaceae sp. FL1651]|nr:hypothetical protein F5Y19DRAFT_483581 [Xylariaceae sp. FL1651]